VIDNKKKNGSTMNKIGFELDSVEIKKGINLLMVNK